MKRTAGVILTVVASVALGAGNIARATTPPPEPDPAATFRLWAAVHGLDLSRAACDVDELTICYGVDAAMATHTPQR